MSKIIDVALTLVQRRAHPVSMFAARTGVYATPGWSHREPHQANHKAITVASLEVGQRLLVRSACSVNRWASTKRRNVHLR